MTPKIHDFLKDHVLETPCLVLDLDVVEQNHMALQGALPQAAIFYADKANPAGPILERPVGLGSRFDAASVNFNGFAPLETHCI